MQEIKKSSLEKEVQKDTLIQKLLLWELKFNGKTVKKSIIRILNVICKNIEKVKAHLRLMNSFKNLPTPTIPIFQVPNKKNNILPNLVSKNQTLKITKKYKNLKPPLFKRKRELENQKIKIRLQKRAKAIKK